MTKERQDINEDFYQGDVHDIQVTIYNQNGTLKDLTGAELTYALFRDDGKNPTLLFQKSSEDVSQIEVTGTGVCLVHLVPPDTFNVYGTFRHQLHLVDATGYAGIVMSGKVEIFRSFARRPRDSKTPAYLTG